MPKKVEVTTNEARHDLGAMGIAFPLCDGGVGSGHRMAQSSIPSAKLGQRCSPPVLLSEHRNPIAVDSACPSRTVIALGAGGR
jgi:hypothetical protein